MSYSSDILQLNCLLYLIIRSRQAISVKKIKFCQQPASRISTHSPDKNGAPMAIILKISRKKRALRAVNQVAFYYD